MANNLVLWPAALEVEAQAYLDAANAEWSASYEPGGIHGYIRNDAYGQWVVPKYGEPMEFDGQPIIEPANLIALRVNGVVAAQAVWPPEEV